MRSTPTTNPEPPPQADTLRRIDAVRETDCAAERRPEPALEVAPDDRTVEESGYGHGV